MFKGITVLLHTKKVVGTDDFGSPEYKDGGTVEVKNVLIGMPSDTDITTANQMGKHIAYTLGIPVSDDNDWTNADVEFWGRKFRTVGITVQGLGGLVPPVWGEVRKNIVVEAYE